MALSASVRARIVEDGGSTTDGARLRRRGWPGKKGGQRIMARTARAEEERPKRKRATKTGHETATVSKHVRN
eukprot:7440088-Pyramimonas_sp.AAC.1